MARKWVGSNADHVYGMLGRKIALALALATLLLFSVVPMGSVRADTPTLTVSRSSATYVENDAGFYVDAGIQIAYSGTVSGAKVSIGAGFNAAQDQLVYSMVAGIPGSYNATTGVLTLTGTAPASSYEAVLRAVRYLNSSDVPTTASRVITFSLSGGSLYNDANGHYYEFVGAPGISWTNAHTEAAARSLYGLQGYLATITSSQENDFLTAKVSGTAWIGASDAAVEGTWRWVAGPEDGSLLSYSNWAPGEPNNSGGNENYCHMMTWTTPPGEWNDLADAGGSGQYASTGYVVEYGGMPGDPVLQLSAAVSVAVEAVNDPPVIGSISDQSTKEDTGLTISLSATDIEGNTPVTFFVSGGSVSTVAGSISGSQLTLTPAANYFTSSPIMFTVTATDSLGASSSTVFNASVAPVNDMPSFARGADQTVLEDCGAQTVSSWATLISAGPSNESSQTLNFSVTNSYNALFSVQPAISSTGTLSYTPAANQNGKATITVTLTDDATAGGAALTTAPQTFAITVNPVNDAPSFVVGPNVSVAEDSGQYGMMNWATSISTGAGDPYSQTLTFQVTGNSNPDLFAASPVVQASGRLSFTTATNKNGAATITLVLRDNGGTANGGVDTSASQTFTVTVTPVNDVPSFTKGADQSVPEDCGLQTAANWAKAISVGPVDEAGQSQNFIVTNSNNTLFSSQPTISSTGTLTYTPALNMNGSATVTVQIHDDGGTANGGVDTSASQTFFLTVSEVNDAPTAVNDTYPMLEDGILTLTPAQLLSNDVRGPANESVQNLVLVEVGATHVNCTVSLNAGIITVCPTPDFNGTASFSYTIQDNGTTAGIPDPKTASGIVTIAVTPVNDMPSFTKSADQSVLEDCGLQTAANWATAISAGPVDEAGQVLNFIVTNDNNALFAAQPAIAPDGTLTYTPALNMNGSATVTVQIHDDGGTANGGVDASASQTFTITVTPVNDPPVNTTLPVIAGIPHAGRTLTTTTGAWNDALDTNVSGTSILSYAYQWQRSTDSGATFVDIAGATSPTYVLTLLDNLQQARVEVTCSDTGVGQPVRQNTTVFSLPVVVLNAAPVITEGAATSVTCDEDESPQPFSLTLHATDADDIDTLTWHIATLPVHGTLALPADPTGLVTAPVYHPAPNWNGSDSFGVQVGDDYGGNASVTVTVTVNPINDAPVCLSLPRVTGSAVVGSVITTDVGVWDDHLDKAPGHVGLQVQWLRSTAASGSGAQAIPGATGLTYNVRDGDAGFFLGVRVTATDDGEGLPHSMQTSVEGDFIQAFDRDRVSPTVQFLHPLPTTVITPTLALEGTVWDTMSGVRSLSIDGVSVIPHADGTFRYDLALKRGDNSFLIIATDNVGNQWVQACHVTYVPVVPYAVSARHTMVLIIGSKTMTVDGAKVTLDAPAVLVEDRTLVPLRAVVEHLGGTIAWNAKTRQITLRVRSITIILTIGKSAALVNGKSLAIDPKNSKVVPILSSGRTMLPLRFVAENLGLQVAWDATTRAVTLSWGD
jgi:hypothetical protein